MSKVFKNDFNFVKSRHFGFCYPAPSGDGKEKVYEYEFDEKGRKHLVYTGKKIDTYEKIQSLRESADFKETIKRILNGDLSKIDVNAGVYADVTKIPNNVPQLLQHFNDLENTFNTLPVDIKKKFGNEFGQYLAAAKNGQVESIIKSDEKLFNKYLRADIVTDDTKNFVNDVQNLEHINNNELKGVSDE